MKTSRVIVVPYDPAWKTAFAQIRHEILQAIGPWTLAVEHVGSTAVEGMSAKPCIDIDVVIEDYSVFDTVVRELQKIGYEHEGNLGIADREAFRYEYKPHLYAHHLYVCPKASGELYRHLTFRDYLRRNPQAIEAYSRVKETAAKLFPDDIGKYMQYKSTCIEALYRQCCLI